MDEQQNKADTGTVFDLTASDGDMLDMIRKPYRDSSNYWNNVFGLKKTREDNLKLWKPEYWKNKDYYDYQESSLYQDNRIFTSVETAVSILNARVPQPEVMPAQGTTISIQMAKDLQDSLYSYVKKYRVLDLFRISTRSLILKRAGYIKLRFDATRGKDGEIVSEFISPELIVVDENARYGDIPRFISHKIPDKTVAELIEMYPESEVQILEMIGVNRKNKNGQLAPYKSQLAKKVDIVETWLTYQEEGETKGSVVIHDEDCTTIIGKMRNPNFNYDDEVGSVGNLFDFPEPPFIPINHLNLGDSYIDDTSLVEQAAPLQKILNRRGFQIMENAEQSGSGLIFNTAMIDKAEVAQLTGSPDERIGVKGDVRSAVARIAPPLLPNYVIEDKVDARNEIDNIFATHDVSRGERSKNMTLGQDMMQQQSDYTRMDDIARAVERMASMYYRYLSQMMKVFYTEEHWFKVTGEDGQFDFLVMKQDFIEDGIDVSVEAGSMMPLNKSSQQQWVSILMKSGLLDPLTVYEVAAGGDLPSPKKMLERFMSYTTDPMGFIGKVKEDDVSREAFIDIQVMLRKKAPEPRDEYTPTYFNFMNRYMTTGEFDAQPEIVKQLFVAQLTYAKGVANRQLKMFMSQMPTEEEMQAANAKSIEQAQQEAEMNQSQAKAAPQDANRMPSAASGDISPNGNDNQQMPGQQANANPMV